MPYLIRGLGNTGYALYCMLGLIGGYLSILTFGAGAATVKRVAEYYHARQDLLAGTLRNSLFMHLAGVVAGAAVVLLARPLLVGRVFDVPGSQLSAAMWVVTCAAVAAPFYSLFQCGTSVFQGVQRYDLVNNAFILQNGLTLMGSVLLLASGRGLLDIAVFYVVVQGAVALGVLAKALRLLKKSPVEVFSSPSHPGETRRFVSFGLTLSVAALAYLVVFQFDKMFIATMLPIGQLSFYLVPAAIMQKIGMLPVTLGVVTLPMFSELEAQGDLAARRRVYRKCAQLVVWLMVPVFGILGVIAPQFLTLWLGQEFSFHGAWPMRLLLAGHFIHTLAMMPANASAGIGIIRYNTMANLSLLSLCCLFWWLLIPRLGIVGAAWGFLLAEVLSFVPYLWVVHSRLFGLSAGAYLRHVCLKPLLLGGSISVGLWLCRHAMYAWEPLLAFAAAAALLYYGVGYLLIDADVRENLHLVVKTLREMVLRRAGR